MPLPPEVAGGWQLEMGGRCYWCQITLRMPFPLKLLEATTYLLNDRPKYFFLLRLLPKGFYLLSSVELFYGLPRSEVCFRDIFRVRPKHFFLLGVLIETLYLLMVFMA